LITAKFLFAGKEFKQFRRIILVGIIFVGLIGFGLSLQTVYNKTSQEQDYFTGPMGRYQFLAVEELWILTKVLSSSLMTNQPDVDSLKNC
jgi:hypothetical protein